MGYAGLGAKVKDSGEKRRTGRITKKGRRDLRYAMVEAAVVAASLHWAAGTRGPIPGGSRSSRGLSRAWATSERLWPPFVQLDWIARKLLIVVWHVLTNGEVDKRGDPENIARSLFAHAYRVGVKNLPDAMSAKAYTRYHLDRMGIGSELTHIPCGSKRVALPPSELKG